MRFAREQKKSALHSTMIIELGRLLELAAGDPSIRCVVITGSRDAFAAGADIREMLERGSSGTSHNPLRVAAWRRIEQFPKPMIAAVNGIAFGAGNELALVCDFVIARSNGQF
ncbi:MAG: enoyl-CoA hydratase-related protein, partial [Bradyrhizobium sp.]